MATFSERLCETLLARNMSAAELSRALGINEGTVSQYKKGLYEPKQKKNAGYCKNIKCFDSLVNGR